MALTRDVRTDAVLGAAVLRAAADGDEAAFAELYRACWPRLVALARRWERDPAAAEDVAQEALARAHRALPDLRPGAALWPWLASIAHHVAIDRWRARRLDEVPLLDTDVPLDDETGRVDDRLAISQALGTLPEQAREALLLTYNEELGSADAAAKLGITRAAFQKLLQRSRTRLRAALATS